MFARIVFVVVGGQTVGNLQQLTSVKRVGLLEYFLVVVFPGVLYFITEIYRVFHELLLNS